MNRRFINPWDWQDEMGYSQAIEITGEERVLHCSGQVSMDAEGNPKHPGDMQAQIIQSLDNIEVVLEEAGYGFADVVRLDCYTTDVDGIFEHWDLITDRLAPVGSQPTCTLLGVEQLAFPELLVELEPTAVK